VKRSAPDFRRWAGYGETAFNEGGRVRVCWAGEAGLLAADGYLEVAWFDYGSAVICDYGELRRLESELDDAPLTWLQMYSFGSRKRANRNANRCC
jgi:hypothetical protein